MKKSKKWVKTMISILAVVMAVFIGVVIFKSVKGKGEEAAEVPTEQPPWRAFSGLNEGVETPALVVYYKDDEDYPITAPHSFEDKSLIREEYNITAKGDVVEGIMTAGAMTSNERYIEYGGDYIDYINCIAYGPNIVLNGYAVPPGDFFAKCEGWQYRGYGPVEYDSIYYIRLCALKNAGIEPVEEGRFDFGADAFLSNRSPISIINMSELELDITFTLEDYDPETKTYYFTAENRGVFSGTWVNPKFCVNAEMRCKQSKI